jgi:hypothetical protein
MSTETAEPTYHFTVVLEQEGSSAEDAWQRLLGYIADAPTDEAIGNYLAVKRVSPADACDECSGTRWPQEQHKEHCSLFEEARVTTSNRGGRASE